MHDFIESVHVENYPRLLWPKFNISEETCWAPVALQLKKDTFVEKTVSPIQTTKTIHESFICNNETHKISTKIDTV